VRSEPVPAVRGFDTAASVADRVLLIKRMDGRGAYAPRPSNKPPGFCYNVAMQKPVAFFDIDGTVFRSSLLIELVERLLEAGVFPEKAREEFEDLKRKWQDREGRYEDYIDAVVKVFRKNIKGVFYGDLADIGREVVAERSKRVYRYTRDLIKELKAEGYFL